MYFFLFCEWFAQISVALIHKIQLKSLPRFCFFIIQYTLDSFKHLYRKYLYIYYCGYRTGFCIPKALSLLNHVAISVVYLYPSVFFYQSIYSPSLILTLVAAVLYNSVAGSLLCQVMYSLLLLPLGTVQPLLSHLLALLEQLNDFNRLLPETGLLEEQELGLETQKTCLGQWNFDLPA